ncbi:hypothetical protein GGX14DRAFT_466923 [Mycena pura]|uniref:F-box domain-containing protein n=1 Tax=Mycena pura TaxID=153505 RepID=A0AAD6V1Q9_9AGAR|nr:hypothetical protein GGX14DRAFT_466923 [Mycena pura]
MSPAPSLSNLAPEVVLAVLALRLCDVSSVVSAGQGNTCRWLNQLAFDKSVWVALCRDLQRRAILDTPYLSARELIALVKRLVHGPETWTPRGTDPTITAEVRTQITLHSVDRVAGGLIKQLKLLESGRYVLFKTRATLECWDAVASRPVWRHRPSVGDGSARVETFAAEEIFAEESLVVLLCVRTYPVPVDRKNYVEVVEVNLRKGTHELLMVGRAPDTQENDPFYQPVIDGNIAAVSIKISPTTTILLLFHAEEHDEIRVVAHSALQPFWRKAVGVGGEQPMPSVHQLPAASVLDTGHLLSNLSIRASPVRSHEYRVWAYSMIEEFAMGTLFSYQLSVRPGEVPQWRVRAPTLVAVWQTFDIPYSGHLLVVRGGGFRIVPPVANDQGDGGAYGPEKYATVELAASGPRVDVALYSGALMYGTRGSVVVKYYR